MDIIKDCVVHGAQTIQCVSVCIIQVVSRIKGFRIWVVDVKLAYIQSDNPLMRKIFISNHAHKFRKSAKDCSELQKTI